MAAAVPSGAMQQGFASGALGRIVRALTWERFAVVAALCLFVSTQVLFQPGILEYWSVERVWSGWRDFFGEALACGLAMWIAVTCAETFTRDGSRARPAAVLLALLLGAACGTALALLLLQPAGFYPPLLNLAGDALRWALWGGIVATAHAHVRRAAQASMALADAEVERTRLERQMVEAHLQVLQAQIEPHFLFNTLAHVKRLYSVSPRTGGEMLTSLRHYLRTALPQMRESDSTLAREFELARAYLSVLQIRMGERLRFTIEVPDALGQQPIPPMMLMTLVENAVKHGIHPRPAGGTIAVRAALRGGELHVEVVDTGIGFRASSGAGVGLANVRARLRGAYGRDAALTLEANPPHGVAARIRLPEKRA